MADKPTAKWVVDDPLVRALIRTQAAAIPDADSLTLTHVADGWDCSVWRLGGRYAVRVPRRDLAVPLIRHEQQHLPAIAARLGPAGLGIPSPVVSGTPTPAFPAPWSIVPWFDGTPGLRVARPVRSGWAPRLAQALRLLHVPAHGDHPVNPVRGVPLTRRADAVAGRLDALRRSGRVDSGRLDELDRLWQAACACAPWRGAPVWIHGDLHPGNVIACGGELRALIDFGDVTAGDPAYDLAVAWAAFDDRGRTRLRAALHGAYDGETWTRAKGWAAALTLLLLTSSDDEPDYAVLASEMLDELAPSAGNA